LKKVIAITGTVASSTALALMANAIISANVENGKVGLLASSNVLTKTKDHPSGGLLLGERMRKRAKSN
jgi:hypothetical protein